MAASLLLSFFYSSAQEIKKDSVQKTQKDTFFLAKKKGWLGKLGRSIVINNPAPADSVSTAKENIAPFMQYAGKPIRKIIITKINYGQSINDTTKSIKNFLTETVQKLHVSTKQNVIYQNLFFKEQTNLNPHLVADNETYLRTIPYLQDAKIMINTTDTDSVDVVILYKDVFPIGGSIVSADSKNIFLSGSDDNVLGFGDRIQARVFTDLNRSPTTGVGVEYVKRNIAGSFIDGTVGYQNIAPTFNNGKRQEKTLYVKLNLPLVHPNRLLTGGFEASTHYNDNLFLMNDSLFKFNYKYSYNYFDG